VTENHDVKAQHSTMWASGDYNVVSHQLQIVSELLCETVDVHAGTAVLDIACGNGNTSLSAARRGCRVTGIDLTPELLEQGRRRAAAEHLNIDFQEGDAESLPFDDVSFDTVLSTFGIMFVPDRRKALSEMLRVLKPGGKIGLANWWSGTALAHRAIIARYSTAPPPNPWTNEDGIRELFDDTVSSLSARVQQVIYRSPSVSHYVEGRRQRFAPCQKVFASLTPDAAENLKQELIAEFAKHNRSGDETLVLPMDYLEVVAVKRSDSN
jgi:ubiquinone/menaquinone biosynthesis C-methylase UbiE